MFSYSIEINTKFFILYRLLKEINLKLFLMANFFNEGCQLSVPESFLFGRILMFLFGILDEMYIRKYS